MKLKRYVLLDNNIIVDLNEWKHLNLREKDNGLHNFEEYKFRPFGNGKIIATSDIATDLIRDNDYVMINGKLHRIWYCDDWDYDYDTNTFKGLYFVEKMKYGDSEPLEDVLHNISAIYKWQGKDLMCVWEKNTQ